jgi:hypothetical protein
MDALFGLPRKNLPDRATEIRFMAMSFSKIKFQLMSMLLVLLKEECTIRCAVIFWLEMHYAHQIDTKPLMRQLCLVVGADMSFLLCLNMVKGTTL